MSRTSAIIPENTLTTPINVRSPFLLTNPAVSALTGTEASALGVALLPAGRGTLASARLSAYHGRCTLPAGVSSGADSSRAAARG